MSTVSTGGAGNFTISTAELAGALTATLLSLLLPLLAFTAACLVAAWVLWKLLHHPARPLKPAP